MYVYIRQYKIGENKYMQKLDTEINGLCIVSVDT